MVEQNKERQKSMSNILLLEDDLSLINGLSFAFKKQGFELNIARTLKEAEELWTDGKYDLLVLDVSLPDGSGFEFCKRVRLTSKVPIIFLTASDEETSIISWILEVMTISQNRSNWGFSFQGLTPYFDVQILFKQQTQNCSRMASKFFCCKDRFSKMGSCWI